MVPPRMALLVALALLASALPLGQAGTRDEPDFTDGRGDVTVSGSGPAVHVSSPAIDLLGVWMEPQEEGIVVGWRVTDLAHRTPGFDATVYSLTFESDHYSFALAQARHDRGAWTFLFLGEDRHGGLEGMAVEGTVDAAENTVRLTLPPHVVHENLHDVVASSLLAATQGGSTSGGGLAWFRDVAPDEGRGWTADLGEGGAFLY